MKEPNLWKDYNQLLRSCCSGAQLKATFMRQQGNYVSRVHERLSHVSGITMRREIFEKYKLCFQDFNLKNSAQPQKLTLPLHVPENYLYLATHQSFLCIF